MPDTRFKLGKRPARPRIDALHAANYFDLSKLPTPPAVFGHQDLITDWGMLGNDQVGDCVIAAMLHQQMVDSAEGGKTCKYDTSDAIAIYSAITDYVPGDETTDNGTDMVDAARHWQKVGFLDDEGLIHKIAAYLSINPRNLKQLTVGAYLFSGAGLGVQLPASAMDQSDAGEPWTVTDAEIEGGHDVYLVGRLANGNYLVVTWGQLQEVTPEFIVKYADEGLLYLSCDCMTNGKTPELFNLPQLQTDLKAL